MSHILTMNDTKNKQTYSKEVYIWLWNYALNYLGRYETSTRKLENKFLERKEKFPYPVESRDYHLAMQAVIEKLTSQNLLSDRRYGLSRFRQLVQRGKALRYIRQDLRQNGLHADIIEEVIEEYQQEELVDSNITAAIRYMKKRRLGAFRSAKISEDEALRIRQKEVASLARQGFSYDLISRLLSKDKEELEEEGYL